MYWFRRLKLLLPGARRRREEDLDRELQANLALAIQEAEDAGLSGEAAERRGHSHFGNVTRAREEARAFWLPAWDAWSQDMKLALRSLLRNPMFSVIAVLSLGLGIGAATALFSLVNTVVLKPLAYRDPGQLVFIREAVPAVAHIYPTLPVNIQHFRFWQRETKSFQSLAAVMSASVTLHSDDGASTLGAARVTSNLFDLLGVKPQMGRGFREGEDQPGNGSVAVITDGLWRQRFGASPSVLGQQARFGDARYSIVGVLPADFRFPKKDDLGSLAGLAEKTDVFLAMQTVNPGWGGDYDYVVFGRLRPGVSLSQGIAELNVLEKRIATEHALDANLHVQVKPLQEALSSPVRTSLAVLLGAVLLLVLLVCVNLANLLLARGSARAREFSMRMALGASRGRLLMSAVMETLALSAIGGALGLLAAQAAIVLFTRTTTVHVPRLDEVVMDTRVIAFAFALSLFCGLLFGALPALRMSRLDMQGALRSEAATISGSRRSLRVREWLIGAEVTLGTLLLFLAALLMTSLWNILKVDRGFSAEQAFDVRLSLPARYRDEARTAFFDRAVEQIRTVPGVHSAAVASKVPLTGESNVNDVQLSGADAAALDPTTRAAVMVNVRFVGDGYFAALGIPLLAGRNIEPADRDRNVAVVSQQLAAKLWPGQNALGKKLSSGSGVRDAVVVGVVTDVHTTRLEDNPTLMVYTPFWRHPYQVSGVVVRAGGEPRTVMDSVRRAVQSMDPEIPAPKMRAMTEIVSESLGQRRFQAVIAGSFAFSALMLAALGIYGVVAYATTLRRHEIGIRMALGAGAASVRWLVLQQGFRPVAGGMIAGVCVALASERLLRGMLYGVQTMDAIVLTSVTGVLIVVAMIACLIPARMASGIQPAAVLRGD